MILVELRSSCSLWPCTGYASCRVAAFGRFGSFQVLGLGPLLILWSRLAARLILYVIMSPQSSVSSVRAKDVTRLKFAQFLAVSGLVCLPPMLLG
ncbi:hypothetical protein Tco_0284586, partial [Tanacetum coccineum]